MCVCVCVCLDESQLIDLEILNQGREDLSFSASFSATIPMIPMPLSQIYSYYFEIRITIAVPRDKNGPTGLVDGTITINNMFP